MSIEAGDYNEQCKKNIRKRIIILSIVSATYESSVMLHFHADIRPGYEKLAEVLKRTIVFTSGVLDMHSALTETDMSEELLKKSAVPFIDST